MCLLLESIKCIDGRLQDLAYHQNRVDRALKAHFRTYPKIILNQIIQIPKHKKGVFKCRFVYDNKHFEYSLVPYFKKKVRSLKIIDGSHVNYSHKYADRSSIEELFKARNHCDDIIIIKNGLVTDSSYANLAFFIDGVWSTPVSPLLAGVKRQKLIETGKLIPDEIRVDDIRNFEKISLINAMLELGEIEIATVHVL